MKTIKVIKAADRNAQQQQDAAPAPVVKTVTTQQQVKGWVSEFQTRKAQAAGARVAFNALFAN